MKSELPSFEELTTPSVSALFAPPENEGAETPFLDSVFAPPAPETYGRITPAAAPVEPAQGKCRIVDDPARRWFASLHENDYPLWLRLGALRTQLSHEEATKALRAAYANYLLKEERAALDEQLLRVKSWRG